MPETMVLRFRDLVEDTISEHRRLIAEFGYVWWGWWSKPDENIPRHTFAFFQEKIDAEGGLSIYLVDSGHLRLYRAELLEIEVAPTTSAIECPEPEKTPGYYSTAKYKAWWRIGEIVDAPEEEITDWSYDAVSEYIDDPRASRFTNKRVFDLEEMLNRRHRTIYFVNRYDPDKHSDYRLFLVPTFGSAQLIDTEGEQLALLASPNELRVFTNEPIFRESTFIVHLSDLHFSEEHHGFDSERGRVRLPLWAAISEDLIDVCEDHPPAAVVISGDFTWRGHSEEFNLAYEFLKNLESATGLRREHFVLVPGNHDIQWSEQPEEKYLRDKPVDTLPEEAERNYRDFFLRYFDFEPNEYLSMGRRYVLGNYISVDIVGLNSCRLEQKHFAGYGYVGLEQLNHAVKQMEWPSERHRTKFRFLVPHHHLMPVTPVEGVTEYDRIYSLALDSGQCIYRALELGVDLTGHGHMHQPFVSSVSRASKGASFPADRTLAIHGAGSAGVQRQHLGNIGKNSYSVYYFDEDRVTLWVRSWSEDLRSFTKDWCCYLRRNPSGGFLLEKDKQNNRRDLESDP